MHKQEQEEDQETGAEIRLRSGMSPRIGNCGG